MGKLNKQYCKDVGEYLGYPSCCVESFISDVHKLTTGQKFSRTENQENVEPKYTGFIPCHKCATNVVNGKIELSDLIKNRQHPVPFPDKNFSHTQLQKK